MANAKTEPVVQETVNKSHLHKYVTVYVPAAPAGEEQQLLLSINGESRYVPRGRNVTLPKYAAEQLMQTIRLERKYERDVAETHKKKGDEQYLL